MSHNSCLAIDFGISYYGLAVGKKETGISTPLTIIKAKNGIVPLYYFDKIISEYSIGVIIIGIPIFKNKILFSKMINSLKDVFHARYPYIQIFLQDESYSSVDAKQQQIYKRKKRDDAIAASLIMQYWFMLQLNKNTG